MVAELSRQAAFHRRTALIATRSLLQWLESEIKRATVFAALTEGVAGVEVAGAHQRLLRNHLANAVHHRKAALEAGAFRQGEIATDLPLILIGNKGRGHRRQARGRDQQPRGQQASDQRPSTQPLLEHLVVIPLQALHSHLQLFADSMQQAWQTPVSWPKHPGAGHGSE